MKILLIDCETSLRTELELMPLPSPCELFALAANEELPNILCNSDFDVLIAEWGCGHRAWFEAIEELQKHNAHPGIILLAQREAANGGIPLKFSVDALLEKPVVPAQLQVALANICKRQMVEDRSEFLERELGECRQKIARLEQQQKDASLEQELTYQELSLAYSRLQDLNKKKNNFISLATHELKTPITVIKGYHRILLDERLGPLEEKQKEVLEESDQNCSRLNRIVNSLLDFSRMEMGRFELLYQENDFRETLRMVLVQLEEDLKRKNLGLSTELDPALPRFKYDRERIKQVLIHLMENSIKYTPAGGEITILARPCFWERRVRHGRKPADQQRRKPANAAMFPEGRFNALLVEVCDSGKGVPQEHQNEIFEEFTQLPVQKVTRSGLGLGLSIVKRIIDAHHGKIWVESEGQVGSKFAFYLPLDPVVEN